MAKIVKANTSSGFHKYFNLKKISESTGIQPDKLYNKFNGRYDSWSDKDIKAIADVLKPAVKEIFKELDINVTFS